MHGSVSHNTAPYLFVSSNSSVNKQHAYLCYSLNSKYVRAKLRENQHCGLWTRISPSMPRRLTRTDTFRLLWIFRFRNHYSIPLSPPRRNVLARINMCELRWLIWLDTLRRVHNVSFLVERLTIYYVNHILLPTVHVSDNHNQPIRTYLINS